MEGFVRLSLADDDLIKAPTLSYMTAQLHHHEVAYTLFANPP
jgi:hypothetical protein